MEFFELIKERRSIRRFKKQAIEEEKLKKILEAANSAPSAGNLQSYDIYLIKSLDKKSKISYAALNQPSLINADILLVFCANPKKVTSKYGGRGTDLYCIQDATIACTYAQLAATDLGLASVWVGAFYETKVAEIIGADPELDRPVAILTLGYPDEKPTKSARRPLKDLVHDEK